MPVTYCFFKLASGENPNDRFSCRRGWPLLSFAHTARELAVHFSLSQVIFLINLTPSHQAPCGPGVAVCCGAESSDSAKCVPQIHSIRSSFVT